MLNHAHDIANKIARGTAFFSCTFKYKITSPSSDSTWSTGYQEVEASLIDNYLNSVLSQKISSFADDSLRKVHPAVTIGFTGRNNSTAAIKRWKHKDSWIVTSCYQLRNYFLITESTMQDEIIKAHPETVDGLYLFTVSLGDKIKHFLVKVKGFSSTNRKTCRINMRMNNA